MPALLLAEVRRPQWLRTHTKGNEDHPLCIKRRTDAGGIDVMGRFRRAVGRDRTVLPLNDTERHEGAGASCVIQGTGGWGRGAMTDEPAQSIALPSPPRRLDELSRLADLLAERVLRERAEGRSIPEAHIHALLDAAILLDKYEADLPATLDRIVDQIEGARREAENGASGFAWLFQPFQGTRA